jgi:hypothetical protein
MSRNRAPGGGGMGFGSSRNPTPMFGAAESLAGRGWDLPRGEEGAKRASKAPSDQAEPFGGRKLRRRQVFYRPKTS